MGLNEQIINAIEVGIQKAAFDMEAHAVRICPVDTGRLRGSIKVKINGNEITILADTDYAEFVEYGTSRMRPQPYLRPAIHHAMKRYIPQRIIEEVRKIQ